jgi:integrase
VAAITTEDVLDVLTPIWTTITPTAVVIRGYIANVLAYAKAMKWRSGENPAAWAENLEHLLAAPAKITKPKKYPSLHWNEIGDFMATLHQQTGVIFRAMEVLILTGLRSNEVVGARWSEINLTQGLWAVPAVRMKERVAHTVPLPRDAVAIFQSLPRCGELVFGELGANDLRELALAKCLRIKPYYDQQSGKLVVTHGFRASLSTWATDAGYDPTLIEVALAHAVGTEVSRRYQRSDMIARRAEMMAAWAKHCG